MIDEALYAKLTGTAEITAIFGSNIRAQTSKSRLSYPMLTYFQVSAGVEETRSVAGPVTVFRTLQQFDLWGEQRLQLIEAANAVREALDATVNDTWGGLAIKACLFDQQLDGGLEGDSDVYRIIQQYRVVYAA